MIVLLLAILAYSIGQARATDGKPSGTPNKPNFKIRCCEEVLRKFDGVVFVPNTANCYNEDGTEEGAVTTSNNGGQKDSKPLFGGKCCVLVGFLEGGASSASEVTGGKVGFLVGEKGLCNPGAVRYNPKEDGEQCGRCAISKGSKDYTSDKMFGSWGKCDKIECKCTKWCTNGKSN